ncbi:MAG: DUF4124 domain-containing protein [Desulfobacterales bacterium]|jgi:hypothetical protein
MRPYYWLWLVIGIWCAGVPAGADIYSWVDENGVRRYSNSPPTAVERPIKQEAEIEFDLEKDRARQEKVRAFIEESSGPASVGTRSGQPGRSASEKAGGGSAPSLDELQRAIESGDLDRLTPYLTPR